MNITKMIIAFIMLTVLSGVIALSPAKATETGITVDKVALGFIKSVTSDNNRKHLPVWFVVPYPGELLLCSIYRFDRDSGKTKRIGDGLGNFRISNTFSGGSLMSIGSVLINYPYSFSDSGYRMINNSLIVISNSGETLDLNFLSKYSPWYPVLSPDGLKLAFLGSRGNMGGLYVLNLKTMSVKNIFSGHLKTIAAWSPDSSKILISENSGYTKNHQIISIDINSAKVQRTSYKGCNVVFSPDGKQIAFLGGFTKMGHWCHGAPVSGYMYVADYPGGKARKIKSSKGAVEPFFSSNGKKLAYWVYRGRDYKLNVIDLGDKVDKKTCRMNGYYYSIIGFDNNKIIAKLSDYGSMPKLKELDLSGSSIKVKGVKLRLESNSSVLKLHNAVKPAFKLYLAGLRSSCLNKLDEASSNYKKAFKALLAFKRSKLQANSTFISATLVPYIAEFKKMAEMSEKDLYLKVLQDRMKLFPAMLNLYIYKYRKLPASMKKLGKYISTSCSNNYIRAKTREAKMQFLMPDQKSSSVPTFEMKIIDDKNIDFCSAPTPWGERLKIHAVKEEGYWRRKEKKTGK